jgi:thioredoxin reductase
LIVGAGPAGLSAALEAKTLGLRALVLEQGSVAHGIRSFPRNKIVLAEPADLGRTGALWLEECKKEELLAAWSRTVRREALPVREGMRVLGVTVSGDGFECSAVDRDDREHRFTARRVLMACGRRGTPRRLSVTIPEPAESSVHYSLADARSFAGSRVLVVGLGDVALEAVVALAHQPETHVVVSYRGETFQRGKARNVSAVRRLIERERVEMIWQSEVTRVDLGIVTLSTPGGPRRVRCEAVLVLIGAVPPWDLLARCGIRRPAGRAKQLAGQNP